MPELQGSMLPSPEATRNAGQTEDPELGTNAHLAAQLVTQ